MKNIFKKAGSTLLAAVLILALTSGTVLANSKFDKPKQRQNCSYDQKIEKKLKQYQQEKTKNYLQYLKNHRQGVLGIGNDTDRVQKLIDTVSDPEMKSKLQYLLNVYNDLQLDKKEALKNAKDRDEAREVTKTYQEKLQAAEKALFDALKESEFAKQPAVKADKAIKAAYKWENKCFGLCGYNLITEKIQKAIDGISDATLKNELQSKLNAYRDLKKDLEAALTKATDRDARKEVLESFRGKIQTAQKTLCQALKDAQVEL